MGCLAVGRYDNKAISCDERSAKSIVVSYIIYYGGGWGDKWIGAYVLYGGCDGEYRDSSEEAKAWFKVPNRRIKNF